MVKKSKRGRVLSLSLEEIKGNEGDREVTEGEGKEMGHFTGRK
jgi:hypothetical protein